jgi:hypothetical protein
VLHGYTGVSATDESVLADEDGGIGVEPHRWDVAVEFAINLPDDMIVSAATLLADVTQVQRDVCRIEDVPSDQLFSDGLGVPIRDVTPHVVRANGWHHVSDSVRLGSDLGEQCVTMTTH